MLLQVVEDLHEKGVHCILIQEHKIVQAERVSELSAKLESAGWNSIWEPAIATSAKGASGGVAVLARARCGLGFLVGSLQSSYISPGRCIGARLASQDTGTFLISSVYATVGIGMTGANVTRPASLGEAVGRLSSHGIPCIVGVFNMGCTRVTATDFAKRLSLSVLVPRRRPTCITSTSDRTIGWGT